MMKSIQPKPTDNHLIQALIKACNQCPADDTVFPVAEMLHLIRSNEVRTTKGKLLRLCDSYCNDDAPIVLEYQTLRQVLRALIFEKAHFIEGYTRHTPQHFEVLRAFLNKSEAFNWHKPIYGAYEPIVHVRCELCAWQEDMLEFYIAQRRQLRKQNKST